MFSGSDNDSCADESLVSDDDEGLGETCEGMQRTRSFRPCTYHTEAIAKQLDFLQAEFGVDSRNAVLETVLRIYSSARHRITPQKKPRPSLFSGAPARFEVEDDGYCNGNCCDVV